MKKIIGFAVGGIVVLTVLIGAFALTQKVDSQEAENIALEQVGGGEIVGQEVSKELLVNEYSYTIKKDDKWYEVEIDGFGNVESIESGIGDGWKY